MSPRTSGENVRLWFLDNNMKLVFVFTLLFMSSLPATAQLFQEKSIRILKTQNFDVRYKAGQTAKREARIVGQKGEVFFQRLESYLGQKPKNKLVISLEGNRGDDPRHRWAYVDDTVGWIHLFRFPEDAFPYQTGLSHELVHAYRFAHLSSIELPPSPAFVFLEEGIAEYLSDVIEPKKDTFSTYGYDLEIVAGQWIELNEDIPLEILLNDQYRLRPLCIPQAYTQQASFIQFVEMKLGRAAIMRLAYAKDIRDETSFSSYFNDSFSNLAIKWRSSTLARFKEIPDHKVLGSQWRTKTPIANLKVCKKGFEF